MTEDDAEQLQDAMEQDYEMGMSIANGLIPDAVNWFTATRSPRRRRRERRRRRRGRVR